MAALATARLCLLFTPDLCRLDPWLTLEQSLDAGIDLVQWRVKTSDPTERKDGLLRCLEACGRFRVPVVVNDQVDLAVELATAGAHVGQDDLPAAAARARLAPGQWLGVSTHDPIQVRAAIAAGADYLGIGPCFATETKGYPIGLDPEIRAATLAAASVPTFAIGGITPGSAPILVAEGFRRFAVSGCVLRSTRPGEEVLALRRTLDGTADSMRGPEPDF